MANTKIDPQRLRFSEASKPKIFEGETVETRWDLKKIIIGVVILLVLGLLGAIMLTGVSKRSGISGGRETLGTTSEDEDGGRDSRGSLSLPTSEDVERIIRETRETISNITAEDLTSSQAAIQKMISDLEVLQGKKDAKDMICDLVCKK